MQLKIAHFFLKVFFCKFFLQVQLAKKKMQLFLASLNLQKKSCNFFGNLQVESFCYAKQPDLGYRKCPSEDGKSSYCIL